MLKQLALFGTLSLNLGMIIVGGYYLGRTLEKYYHLPNMTIIGIVAGLILGFLEMFILAYRTGRKK
jgi:uncharacterized membrane protein